jgi:hypothetical protein
MQSLKAKLEANLDSKRYVVNATFDYSYCDANPSCAAHCSISDGASALASTILSNTLPGNNVIIIGFSMGGLMARDLIAHNYANVVTTRKITALLTLGTPNLGYPYGSLDSSFIGSWISGTCPILAQQMYSDFRSQQSSHSVFLSPYLSGLASLERCVIGELLRVLAGNIGRLLQTANPNRGFDQFARVPGLQCCKRRRCLRSERPIQF